MEAEVTVDDGIFSNQIPVYIRVIKDENRKIQFTKSCQRRFELDENARINTRVAKVTKHKSNLHKTITIMQMNITGSDDVTFAIETQTEDANFFRIDPLNGIIFTQQQLSRELITNDVINLVVTARDVTGKNIASCLLS